MIYYIYSEAVSAIKSKYARYYMLALLGVSILANLTMIAFRDLIYGTNDGTYGYNLIMFAGGFFWLPYYTMIFVADMVFGRDYPDPHIRKRSNIGLNRTQLYLGKLFAAFLVLVLVAVLAFMIFIGVSLLFQVGSGAMEPKIISDFAINLLIAFPLFLAGIAIGFMCLFCFPKKRTAFILFWVLVIVIPRIIMILGAQPIGIQFFKSVKNTILLTPQFTELQFYATRNVPKVLISSAVYIILSTVIGCIGYRRRKR
ncbi:MAG: hypothetical protein K6F35_11510 [Lachnospiraceae bacterium]|nr:hypothetical protein [Lachnospiraceae bacterium]